VVLEAGGDDLTSHGIGQRDVGADIEAEPGVGPLRGGRPARIDGVEAGAAMNALQQVVEEDRVRLAGIGAPQEDEIRLLDLTV
jgi:hypothetical protein